MKKSITMICLAILLSFAMLFSGCAQTDDSAENETESAPVTQPPMPEETHKTLVVWFSATGTTEEIAQRLADYLSADAYEIVPETPYTAADLDYADSGSRTSMEQNDASARPAIAGALPDMQKYDTVFIGYPIWHGQAPRILSTFLEGCDLSEKAVIPFCTSGSSDIGTSADDLQTLAKDANWAEGIRFAANAPDEELFTWADEILPNVDHGNSLYIHVGDATLSATLANNSSAPALKKLPADGDLTVSIQTFRA